MHPVESALETLPIVALARLLADLTATSWGRSYRGDGILRGRRCQARAHDIGRSRDGGGGHDSVTGPLCKDPDSARAPTAPPEGPKEACLKNTDASKPSPKTARRARCNLPTIDGWPSGVWKNTANDLELHGSGVPVCLALFRSPQRKTDLKSTFLFSTRSDVNYKWCVLSTLLWS